MPDLIEVIDGGVTPTRRTIATNDPIARGIGDSSDAPVTQGASGSMNAKFRLLTSQMNTLLSYTDGIEGSIDSIETEIDDLEEMLDALNVSSGTVYGAIGPMDDAAVTAGAQGSVTAKLRLMTSQLNTLLGYVDTVEATLGTILGFVDGIEGQLGGALTIAPSGYNSAPSVTRSNNTTAYPANSVVGGAITFTNAGPSGGRLLINTASLRINIAAVTTGITTFRLYLYDVTPPSALADNAAWDLPSGDRASFLGYIDLGSPVDMGSTLYVQPPSPGLQVKLAAASTSLFGYLVTAGAYTPAALEVYVPSIAGVGV